MSVFSANVRCAFAAEFAIFERHNFLLLSLDERNNNRDEKEISNIFTMISVICLHFRFLARCFFIIIFGYFDILFRKYCFVVKLFDRFDFWSMIESVFCCLFFFDRFEVELFFSFPYLSFSIQMFRSFFINSCIWFISFFITNAECRMLVGRVISILLI